MQDDCQLSLQHQVKHTWRPVDAERAARLFQENQQLDEVMEEGLNIYWEIFLASKSPACVVLTAIELLQRTVLADQGVAPLTPCLPAACLWIASKVVEGQNSPFTYGSDFLPTWNDACEQLALQRYAAVLAQLLEAEAHVLVQLRFEVTYATTYDLVAALLRMADLARDVRLRGTVRVVETLMLLEGKPHMLEYRPSEIAACLCSHLNVPVPDYFPTPSLSLQEEVNRAWHESFEV